MGYGVFEDGKGGRDLETVAFTFQKIEQLSPAGTVLASDTWKE